MTRAGLLALLATACGGSGPPPKPVKHPPLSAPREPPAPTRTIRDAPYLQELDHPLLDGDPGRVPIAAIVMPPDVFHPFAAPLAVLPRGIRSADAPEGGALQLPAAEPDLFAAATTAHDLVVTSSTTLHVFPPAGPWRSIAAPDGVAIRAVASGTNRFYVLASDGLHLAPEGTGSNPVADVDWRVAVPGATAALETFEAVYVATTSSIARYNLGPAGALGRRIWQAPLPSGLGRPVAILADLSIPESIDLVVFSEASIAALRAPPATGGVAEWLAIPAFSAGHVPYAGIRSAIRLADGGFLVAAREGAMRMIQRGDGPEWRVYNPDRWIPSSDVRGVAAQPGAVEGPIWIATALGVAQITARRINLETKLQPFVDRIVTRHDRDGAVADSHLLVRGDPSQNIAWDSDNDGSWTSYWLRAECYRWKVTGAPDAKAHFDRALDAMLRLRDVTGTDWFVARAVIRKSTCILDDCDAPDDGAWFTSPDGEWWVKRDTSNDEVIAHVAMMAEAFDVCADNVQQARIKEHVVGIIGGIMDHGWQLIDPVTNAVTTYGQFDPAYVNESIPGTFGDGGTRSVEILAGLTLAHYLTGDEKFWEGKQKLITDHHYAENAEKELEYPVRLNLQDNDEMGVWGWMVLNRYEPDPDLYARWQAAWRKNWHLKYGLEQAAWWNLVHAFLGGPELELDTTLRWLRLAPVDMIRWDVVNSNRRDLVSAGEAFTPGGKKRSDGRIIPYDERPCDRWNTDQFKVDGGMNGTTEMDGADVLAPYWMARYYGWITRAPGI